MNKQSQKKNTKCWDVARNVLFPFVFYFPEGDKQSVLLVDHLLGTATVALTPTLLRFCSFLSCCLYIVHGDLLSSLQLPGTSRFLFVPPAPLPLLPLPLPLPLPPLLPLPLLLPRILWRIRTQPGTALMCEGRMMSRCNGHNSMFRRGRNGARVQLRPLDLQDGALILKVQKPQSDLHTRAGHIHLNMDSIDTKANIGIWSILFMRSTLFRQIAPSSTLES